MTQPVPLAPPPMEARFAPRPGGIAFGRRFFILLVVGLVFLGPAFLEPRFGYAILAWDVALLVLWFVDWLRLPPPDKLSVRRSWNRPAALASPADLELLLHNDSARALAITATDDLPPELNPTPVEMHARLVPHGERALQYSIVPACRGDALLGKIYLRYQSALQLAERWAVADLPQTVRVYPNLPEAGRHHIYLLRSRQIEMEKRLQRVRGLGREFESLREYREGDEMRDICWSASGRRGKLVTKIYQVERSQVVWTVLDCGRLMRARVGQISKLDWATTAALSLHQVALYSGDRVGLLSYGRRTQQRILPGRGSAHLRHIVEALARTREEVSEADHLLAAAALLSAQRRRSLVVWITDLAETAMTPEVIEAASALLPQHVLLFVVIGEPDLARAANTSPGNVDQMFQVTAAQEVLHRREVLLARLRERGALAIEVSSARLPAVLVNSYLEVKARNRL